MSAFKLNCDEIRAHLFGWGVPPEARLVIPDAEYAFPKADWVDNEFTSRWFLEKNHVIAQYEAENADCDDFAEECATFAHRCHRMTSQKEGRPADTALAFGQFYYTKSVAGPHAICFFIALKDDAWCLYFYEPQLCQRIELSPEEIATCELAYF